MKKKWAIGIGVVIAVLLLLVVAQFNWTAYNFGVVEEGKLYRSAEPSRDFLEKLIQERGLKTIVILTRNIQKFEKELAEKYGVTLHHLPMSTKKRPPEEHVKKFRELIQADSNFPMLVHCYAGADRTGFMIAIKRIEQDGWSLKKARSEMWHYRHLKYMPMDDYLKEKYGNKTTP